MEPHKHPLRHHRTHKELHGAFGHDAYGRLAESIARSMGTPWFLGTQIILLILWILANGVLFAFGFHLLHWDPYPFILLNLCLSVQAAFAAPFILVAANRQAVRDKAREEADAKHRQEEFDRITEAAMQHRELLAQNTQLTQNIHRLMQQLHDATLQ